MIEVGYKDRLFVAVAVPLALAAAYVWGWRLEAAKRLDALAAERDALVAPADFAAAKERALARLREAEDSLAAEKAKPEPGSPVAGDEGASRPSRERAVLAVFAEAGVDVLRIDDAEGGRAGEALRATGVRPEPVCRRYTLSGTYPAVRRAFDSFSSRRMAVVPESAGMSGGRWMVSIWE